jgi:hypothetical protein
VELHPNLNNNNFTIHTQIGDEAPRTFTNVGKDGLISALKKEGTLDERACVISGQSLQAYLDHDFEILLFYRTIDGIAVEMALDEGGVILKQRTIVEPGEFAEFMDVDVSDLDNHELAVTLTEFMRKKERENEQLVVNAYKKSDDGYIVHLNGEGDMTEFTFASVPPSDLAKAMNTKEKNLKSEMNEEVFEGGTAGEEMTGGTATGEKSTAGTTGGGEQGQEKKGGKKPQRRRFFGANEEEDNLPKPGTFKNLIEHGGRIVEAEKIKQARDSPSTAHTYKVRVQVCKAGKTFPNMKEETVKGAPGFEQCMNTGMMEE